MISINWHLQRTENVCRELQQNPLKKPLGGVCFRGSKIPQVLYFTFQSKFKWSPNVKKYKRK